MRRSPTSRPTSRIGRTPKTRWRWRSGSTSCGACRVCIEPGPRPCMNLSPSPRHTLAWLRLALLARRRGRVAGRGWRGLLAVVLVEATALLLVAALLLLIVPVIGKELPLLKAQVPALLDKLDRNVAPWLAQFGIQINFDVASLKA